MRGDVAAAATAGITPQRMPGAHRNAAESGYSGFHAVEHVTVAHQQLRQPREVVATPQTVRISLAGSHAAIGDDGAIEGGIENLYPDLQIGVVRSGLTEFELSAVVVQQQPSMTQ